MLVVSAFLPFGCKPIPYYLEQVCKVYGQVTDAKTGDRLESVEVSVDPYQYSELTNGLGNYELEMAVGAWTVTFTRDGYETQSVDVKLEARGDRIEVNAALVPENTSPLANGTITAELTGAVGYDTSVFVLAVVAAGEEILPDYSNLIGSDVNNIINGDSTCIAMDTSSQAVSFTGGESYDAYAFIFANPAAPLSPGDYQLKQPRQVSVNGDMVVNFVFPDDFDVIQ